MGVKIADFQTGLDGFSPGTRDTAQGANGTSASIYFTNPANGDVQTYKSSVTGGSVGGSLEFWVKLPAANVIIAGDASAVILDQGGWKWTSLYSFVDRASTAWQKVTIPLSKFTANGDSTNTTAGTGVAYDPAGAAATLSFRFWNSTSRNWYVDEIYFTGGPFTKTHTTDSSLRAPFRKHTTDAYKRTSTGASIFAYKSIDVMGWSKDYLRNPYSQAAINAHIAGLARDFSLTHIAIAVPMNTQAEATAQGVSPFALEPAAYMKRFTDAIHAQGLGVIHRGTDCYFEGIYDFPKWVGGNRIYAGTAESVLGTSFTDDFNRASIGTDYYTSHQAGNTWTISSGVLTGPTANLWKRTILTRKTYKDASVLVKMKIKGNQQVVLRASADSNYPGYGFQLRDGNTFRIERPGLATLGQVTNKTLVTGDWWWVRAECTGTTIRGRAWKDGTAEPGTWDVSATDSNYSDGCVGLSGESDNGEFDSITITPTQSTNSWLGRVYNFIVNNPTLFADGDLWAAFPEATGHGIFSDNTSFLPANGIGVAYNFANFFVDLATVSKAAFAVIGKKVRCGFSAQNWSEINSGWLPSYLHGKQGLGRVLFDHYGTQTNNYSASEMLSNLESTYSTYQLPMFHQEWGDYWSTDPAYGYNRTQSQHTTYLQSMYAVWQQLINEGKLLGFNYWRALGGAEAIYQNSGDLTNVNAYSRNYAGNALADFFAANPVVADVTYEGSGATAITKTHSTDAVKRKQTTKAHTTDSIKRKPLTRLHTTDALKRRAITTAHTADSFKQKNQVRTHTTNALKRKQMTLAHSTDSIKRKSFTTSHTTNALKRRSYTWGHTTDSRLETELKTDYWAISFTPSALTNTAVHASDALKRKIATATHTIDTLKRKLFTSSHTTNTVKRKTGAVLHTTDALKRKGITRSHTTDAGKRKSTSILHTTDSSKRKVGTRSHITDALRRKTGTVSHATDMLKRKGYTLSHTTNTVRRKAVTVQHTTDASRRIAGVEQFGDWSDIYDWQVSGSTFRIVSHSIDAIKRTVYSSTHKTDTILRKSPIRTHLTDTLKKKASVVAHTTNTVKRVARLVAHATDALRRGAYTISHTTGSVVRRQNTLSHTTDSVRHTQGLSTYTTDAFKRIVRTIAHTTDAFIKRGQTITHTTSAATRMHNAAAHSTDTLKRKEVLVFHTASSYKRLAGILAHTTDTLIRQERTLGHTTDAFTRQKSTNVHTTDTIKRIGRTRMHTTDASIQVAGVLTHTTDVLKRSIRSLFHTIDANKRTVNTKTHTTTTIKRREGVLTHTTDALLLVDNGIKINHTTDALRRRNVIFGLFDKAGKLYNRISIGLYNGVNRSYTKK